MAEISDIEIIIFNCLYCKLLNINKGIFLEKIKTIMTLTGHKR